MGDATFDRRRFLRVAARGVVGVAGAAAIASCGDAGGTPAPPPDTGPATEVEWRRYATSLAGPLVREGRPGYERARLLYNPRFDTLAPLAVAYCASPSDVARSILFARTHDYPVAIRSGGHSYAGYSSGNGRLVIDVTRMSHVGAAPRPGGTAVIWAGARLIDVYESLGTAGQLFPAGSCPSVGAAGLTLGGGVGVFARKFGLASDQVQAVTVVTADGVVRRCTPSEDADLLWACRGGGGGNFGVVTSFEVATHAMPDVTLFTLDFPWGAAAEVLGSWQHWTSTANPAVWSNCQLLSGAGTSLRVAGVACASPTQTTAWLAPLLNAVGTAPTYTFVGDEEYVHAMMIEAGCAALTVAACHLTTATPAGALSREAFAASSNYVARPMSAAALDAVVARVNALAAELPELGGGLVFDALGGAVDAVQPGDTAFVHRGMLASIQSSFSWSASTPPSAITEGNAWLASVRSDVYDASTGAYQNYIDPTLPAWKTAYYGTNLARLEQVKAHYDPDNLFSFAQSIPRAPTGA
jgi:FAD binding domain/Berberine and berberine like